MPALTPEIIALARERYLAGDPISRILADTGMAHGTLYMWLDGGPDDGSGPRLAPIPRRRTILARKRRPLAGSPVSLVNRLWRTAERQVRDIEDRLRRNQQPSDERERDTRMLAVIVKTVRELRAMQNINADQTGDTRSGLEEFRRELARKIDGLIAERGEGPD